MNFLSKYLLSSLLLLTGCSMRSDSVVLKLAHGMDQKHSLHRGLQYMAERLDDISGGRMAVDIYPSAILGNETQCVELIQIGSLAMTCRSTASLEGFVEEYKVFGIPYLLSSKEHLYAVLDGNVGEDLKTLSEKYMFRGLGYFDAGARNFYSMKKPVETPGDLAGQKIRVMKSPMAVAMMQAFGGSATPISWPELYTALQSGVVDGAENNLPSFVTAHHYEVVKHYSFSEHTRPPDVLIISAVVWRKLSGQQRAWLEQAVREASLYHRQLWDEQEKDALQEAQQHGVTFYYPDQRLFADKVAGMKESYRSNARIWRMVEKIDSAGSAARAIAIHEGGEVKPKAK